MSPKPFPAVPCRFPPFPDSPLTQGKARWKRSSQPLFFETPRMHLREQAALTPKGQGHVISRIALISSRPAAPAAGLRARTARPRQRRFAAGVMDRGAPRRARASGIGAGSARRWQPRAVNVSLFCFICIGARAVGK